jgi:hypothetical protein
MAKRPLEFYLIQALGEVPPSPLPNRPLEYYMERITDVLTEVGGVSGDVDELKSGLEQEILDRKAYDQEQDLKLQTLNGHYIPLEPFNFGKSLDVKTPNNDDVSLLTSYAISATPGASAVEDIRECSVVKNLFDGVEFIWNDSSYTWLDWGVGNIVTAGNDHLGVVEGVADPGDGSRDGMVTVLPGGTMKSLGVSDLKGRVNSVEGAVSAVVGHMGVVEGDIDSLENAVSELQDAGSSTDDRIGPRTLSDEAADGVLVPTAAKLLTAWLQGIRNNIKFLFANKVDKSGTDRLMTQAEGTKLAGIDAGAQVNPGNATASAPGLMSAADKTKLDGVATGAQVNPGNATTSVAGLMSSADKTKLDGVAAGAQVNPGVVTTSANGLMSSTDKSKLDNIAAGAQVNPGVATTSANGLMSAADKTKLNGIAAGAQVNPGNATTSVAGLMSSTDKAKLDGVAAGAQANPALATQAEAEAGTDNAKMMSPLRVAQAIAKVVTTALLKLTGYSKPASSSAIVATDSVNSAIGKLEKALDGLAPANVTLSDGAASTTLPAVTSSSVAALLQTVRNALKALFGYFASGVANSAAKWSVARTVSLSGDVSGSVSVDGSKNVAIPATLADSGVAAGSYGPAAAGTLAFGGTVNIPQVTLDKKGRATSAANRAIKLPDVPSGLASGNVPYKGAEISEPGGTLIDLGIAVDGGAEVLFEILYNETRAGTHVCSAFIIGQFYGDMGPRFYTFPSGSAHVPLHIFKGTVAGIGSTNTFMWIPIRGGPTNAFYPSTKVDAWWGLHTGNFTRLNVTLSTRTTAPVEPTIVIS